MNNLAEAYDLVREALAPRVRPPEKGTPEVPRYTIALNGKYFGAFQLYAEHNKHEILDMLRHKFTKADGWTVDFAT